MTSNTPNQQRIRFQPHDVEWNKDNIERMWDFYGSSSAKDSLYFGAKVGSHVARTIKRLGLFKKTTIIVDFSCGKGHLIEHCLSHLKSSTKISGYDPSKESITAANSRNKQSKKFSGAYHLPSLPSNIKDDFADLILLTEVIEHLDDNFLESILSECYRILKPGGKFFITTPNNEQLEREKTMCPECGCKFHRWQHMRTWTARKLKEALSKFGFTNTNTNTIAWGNELINLAFTLARRKKTGLYAVTNKPDTKL